MLAEPDSLTANWLKVGSIGPAPRASRRWSRAAASASAGGKLPDGRGLGLACGSYLCGAGLPIYWNHMPQSGVQLKLDRSGGVTVFCGETEIGQGSDSVLAAVSPRCSASIPSDIRAASPATPTSRRSTSAATRSRVTADDGQRRDPGRRAGARDARRGRLRAARGRRRDGSCSPTAASSTPRTREGPHLRRGRRASRRGAASAPSARRARYIAAALARALQGRGRRPLARLLLLRLRSSRSRSIPATGWITVPTIWIAHDIGRAHQPGAGAGPGRGQRLHGARRGADGGAGVPPPAAAALARAGAQASRRCSSTRARPRSTCREVDTYLIEDPDPNGPFGAKEVGQGPLLPVMPAVANAIYDAVGVRVDEVPITPDKVLKALEAKAAGKDARVGPTAFPGRPVPRTRASAAAVGRRRRQREEKAAAKPKRQGARGMMRPSPVRALARRTSVQEAARILAGEGPNAMLIAGGTDLLPNMKRRQMAPKILVVLAERSTRDAGATRAA